MKARWGSQAEADADAAATAVSGGGSPDAGGQGGGIWRVGGEPLLVAADRLAIDPREALYLALAGAGPQQGPDGCL